MKDETELLIRESAYRQCQLDLQDILLELKTPGNIALLVEIDARIHHAIEMRIATQFAPTTEEAGK